MANDKLKGKTNEMVGAARQKTGELTGNEKMEGRGAGQRVKGKAQQALGDVKDEVKEAAKKVKDAAGH